MITADHDRRLELALLHHLVESEAQAMALAEADPADACRQALESDALLGHVEPVVEMRIVGDQLLHALIGLVDVLRIAGKRGPAEGTDAAAEQGTDIGRNETWESEGVLETHVEGHLA